MDITKNLRSMRFMAILGAMTFWSTTSLADPINVDFTIGGFAEGATLAGSFTGEDTDNSGSLEQIVLLFSELSEFNVTFSGNSITQTFSHGLGNLLGFSYNITSNTLNGFATLQIAGFLGANTSSTLLDNFGSDRVARINGPRFFPNDRQGTTQNGPIVQTAQVPEPGTLTLFGLGLLAIGFASRRRSVVAASA